MYSRIELRCIKPGDPQQKQFKEQRALLLYLFEVSEAGVVKSEDSNLPQHSPRHLC
jgi:hypothetical protein